MDWDVNKRGGAYQFTLIVDCHRVLNNNGHILGLRCGLQEDENMR